MKLQPRRLAFSVLSTLERFVFRFRAFGPCSVIKPYPRKISGAKYISIGADCFFGDSLTMIATKNYLGKEHQPSCVIEDGCTFGAELFLSCTKSIRIGRDVLASARVYIGDSYHGYEDVSMPVLRQPMTGEADIDIGEGCFLGIGCAILPGVRLGKGCVVGANAVVTKSFESYTVLVGAPATAVRRYNPQAERWEQV